MKKITEYFRLLIFVACMLLGIQAPGFVDQYEKSLDAHLRESNLSLAEFQDDADEFFAGDLEKLIKHYQKDQDKVFNNGGESIDALYQRNQLLKQTFSDFNSNLVSPYLVTLKNPVPDVLDEVKENYSFSVILNKLVIVVGLIFGFIPLIFMFLLKLIFRLFSKKK